MPATAANYLKRQRIANSRSYTTTVRCDICEVRLSTNYALRKHIVATHQRQKAHLCVKCGKRFAHKQALRLHHIRIHTIEFRVYHCEQCSFSTKYTGYTHL